MWGYVATSCIWSTGGHHFPMLKCMNFTYILSGEPISWVHLSLASKDKFRDSETARRAN